MVLANKYVDDVLIGAPFEITEDLIKTFNIHHVVQSNMYEQEVLNSAIEVMKADPYAVPKAKGIFETIEVDNYITAETIS